VPFVLLPLMSGADNYADAETDALPEELQLLASDVGREPDLNVLKTHVETILLLTSTREGRERLRADGVYPVIRECHLAVEDDEVREVCERCVQMLMRDEEGEEGEESQGARTRAEAEAVRDVGGGSTNMGRMITQADIESGGDEDRVIEIF
jgi:hypothetical protein